MCDLSKGNRVNIGDDVEMITDDYFKLKKRDNISKDEVLELDDSVNDSAVVNDKLTPGVMLSKAGKFIIIDAYNGSSEKEVKKKLNLYKNGFKAAEDIFVVTSALSAMEQIVSQQRGKFVLYRLGKGGDLEKPQELRFGTKVLDIEAFSSKYKHQLEIFAAEARHHHSEQQVFECLNPKSVDEFEKDKTTSL